MQLKTIWHRQSKMPSISQIKDSYATKGKFVAISPDIFGGWSIYFENSNSATFLSPLRYPGGKNRLSKLISKICLDNDINGHYIEPYAGGASVALYLLQEDRVDRITINDYDRSIYAFWYCVLNHSDKLCEHIGQVDIDMNSWRMAKEVQANKKEASLFDLGFSTLFLNRTNVSGIISGGVIGGISQQGKYKMDCRFNKEEIIKRIMQVAAKKERISLYNLDAMDLISKRGKWSNDKTLLYLDPPYYVKGASLYMNHYNNRQHMELSKALRSLDNVHWVISYDDTLEIRDIYSWVGADRTKRYSITHTAASPKEGREIMYSSKNLRMPDFSLNI